MIEQLLTCPSCGFDNIGDQQCARCGQTLHETEDELSRGVPGIWLWTFLLAGLACLPSAACAHAGLGWGALVIGFASALPAAGWLWTMELKAGPALGWGLGAVFLGCCVMIWMFLLMTGLLHRALGLGGKLGFPALGW